MTPIGKILVVDDELGIREGCRRVLEPQGYVVDTAATLREGLTKIQADGLDLVLLDVMLSDGRGIDLLGPMRQKDPDMVPVIITGYATVEMAVEAIKLGAYDFISKPFNADLLLMAVRQGLEKRQLSLETKRLQLFEQKADELARAQHEMEQLHRFKSNFTYIVAHELRSPVAAAQSLLRTMKRGLAGELNERQVDIVGRVEARLDLLMLLINDLLSLAASRTLAPEESLKPIVLQPLLQQAVDRLAPESENKELNVVLEVAAGLPAVAATEEGIERVLNNLIGNAVKYTPESGEVRISATAAAGEVAIAVCDTGIGIPAEDLRQIWNEFYRAQNARRSPIRGTGLGLSIVRQYVERFGGRVAVESTPGKGSTFTVFLCPHGLKDNQQSTAEELPTPR
jgi:signal transduction histidine kinase